MSEQYTWVTIYDEIAKALIQFKEDRQPLVEWIYSDLSSITRGDGRSLISYLHNRDGSNMKDIDPFSVMAIFNRGISDENKSAFIRKFKDKFDLKSDVPADYTGVPLMNDMRSFFYKWGDDEHSQIETLWDLFVKVENEEPFENEYNSIIARRGIKFSITMGLFWIKPEKYLALDSNNRDFLKKYGIKISTTPDYKEYIAILSKVSKMMESRAIPCESFCELSYSSWGLQRGEEIDGPRKVWMWMGGSESFNTNSINVGNSVSFEVKDFSIYKKKTDLRTACQHAQKNTDVSISDAYWKFMKDVSVGDYVVVFSNKRIGRKNAHVLYGWGEITSDLIHVKGGENPIKREVSWQSTITEDTVIDDQVRNNLFFHGTTPSQAAHIKSLLGISDNTTDDMIPLEMAESSYKKYIELLLENSNLILTGAPGTGKTYMAKEIAKEITHNDDECIGFVQFHPSYDYTDFVEGLRPVKDDDGKVGFERKDGVFKVFCKKAIQEQGKSFVFLIDEINRGELSKIFGELFFSLDPGYRGHKGTVKTQYQNLIEKDDEFFNGFYVPENIFILATMNDIDRSVESMDFAMRRRFTWEEITPEDTQNAILEPLGNSAGSVVEVMKRLNDAIASTDGLGHAFMIGPAYFLKLVNYGCNATGYEKLWNLNLKPLLREYLRGFRKAKDILSEFESKYYNTNSIEPLSNSDGEIEDDENFTDR